MYAADLATTKAGATRLGTYSSATVETEAGTLTIFNAYMQFHWKGPGGGSMTNQTACIAELNDLCRLCLDRTA